ncbi:GTPase Obg [Patescibacteria group bacterium]|nr:GTPase Obg [Patescibacteria group bacterium]
MFRDLATAKFIAGKGGDGRVALKSLGGKKRADGGIGGKGGDIYLEGSTNLYDLSFIKKDEEFKAENGEIGGVNNSTGKNGKDLVVKVPIATNVYNQEGNLIVRIDKPGQKELILKGGSGGKGNIAFKKGGEFSLYEHTKGTPGEELNAKLELELLGEVIFIGLPNAGKSSILNAITNANAKVASYAFTTLIPQLGRLGDVTLMDLPGLIEKTFEGKGLGTKFVKHTKSAKLLLHFISLENPDLLEAYNTIRQEIKNIDEHLYNLPELIVLTKSDVIENQKQIELAKNMFKEKNLDAIIVSVIDDQSLQELKNRVEESIKNFN